MKKILILGAGNIQVPIILKAKELGLYCIVADMDSCAPGFEFSDEQLAISTLDTDKLMKYAENNNLDGVLTTSDYPVNVVASISKKLHLSAMPEDVAKICTNKYLQRELFLRSGVHTPAFYLCDQQTDLSLYQEFPYVVKPVDSSASRGVQRVDSLAQLKDAFDLALSYSRKGQVLIEDFIDGREFSVETFTQKGRTSIIAVTEKLIIGEDEGFFVEDTHIEPARIAADEYGIIAAEVIKAINIIGLDNCPSHTEVKLNSGGAFIIEIACRLGGDYITSDLVPLSTGVDMLGNLVKISLGETIDVTKKRSRYSCVQFLNPQNYTRCVEFIESHDAHISRYDIRPYSKTLIKSSLDRLGYIIFSTDTLAELESILDKIK